MYEDVLLPTDGSSGIVEAVEHALTVAGEESTVHALYVVDRRHVMAAEAETKDEIRRSLEEKGDHALEDAHLRVEEAGVACETTCEEGIPHKTIVEFADEKGMDVVVMGTHGETGPQQAAAMGSTTERVVENATVPVLVVDID